MSTDKVTYTKGGAGKVDATRSTLRKCFVGQLTENQVDEFLQVIHDSNILLIAPISGSKDVRVELPYGRNVEKFDVRLEEIQKRYTRYALFGKNAEFSRSVEEKIWSKNDATFGRMCIATCAEDTTSLNQRFTEVQQELSRCSYKIGLLVVVISEASHYAATQTKLQEYIAKDKTERHVFCILKKELSAQTLEDWHRAKTHYELANEEGSDGSKNKYEQEMANILESWSSVATNDQLIAFYKDKSYPSVFGSGDLMRHIKKDVLFSVFRNATEQIVPTSTAYRRAQESAAFAGIVKESKNAQIKSIEQGLIVAGVWDCDTIETLEAATGTNGAKAICELAKFIHSKMTQGAKIRLDELWLELQKSPFGYYNNLSCAYLLGFVFRYWVNGEFNWVNSDSNPFPLNESNLATMINNMCQDKVPNNTLSSGSEIWQKFKPYLEKVFEMNPNEIPNEERARHFLIKRITESGTPIWALKYVEQANLGSAENKAAYDVIIDNFCFFAQKLNDQEDVMAKVVSQFTGKGKVRQILAANFSTDSLRYAAFKRFILESAGDELNSLITKLKLNDNDLFDAIKRLMQSATNTWTEEQVKDKLLDLTLEYAAISELNDALGISEKTLTKHIDALRNCFGVMKVPGTIIETLNMPWFVALTKMRYLTVNPWQNLDVKEKSAIIDCLKLYAKEAWQNISSSKSLLGKYLDQKGVHYTETDLDTIYIGIKECDFGTQVPLYESVITPLINEIKHEHNKILLLSRWKEISGFNFVREWCKHYLVPIQWVANAEDMVSFNCVYQINCGHSVDGKELSNAVTYLNSGQFLYLKDADTVKDKFFEQVGEKYRSDFQEYQNDIYTKIRTSCGTEVFGWANQGGKISGIIEAFIKSKYTETTKSRAIEKVNGLQETELRARILSALESLPELYKFFVE